MIKLINTNGVTYIYYALLRILSEHIDVASNDILHDKCSTIVCYESSNIGLEDPNVSQSISTVIDNIERADDGRLIVPILWNERNSHMLANNFNLSKNILMSNLKKYKNYPAKLNMIDDVFQDQLVKDAMMTLKPLLEKKPHCNISCPYSNFPIR